GLDHRRGGKTEQRGHAFTFQDFYNGMVCAHRFPPSRRLAKPRRGPADASTVDPATRGTTEGTVMLTSIGRRALLGAGAAAVALPRRSRAADKPIRIGVLTDMAGPYAANTGLGS